MARKALVAYATRCGSTAEVAAAIGKKLRRWFEVDVLPVAQMSGIAHYDAVILGSAIRTGRWLREAAAFAEQHREMLGRVPVAYFVVCLEMRQDTEENRCTAASYLDIVRERAPQVRPVDVGLFAGALDRRRLPFFLRFAARAIQAPEADFRDWDAIRAWAASIAPTLKPAGTR